VQDLTEFRNYLKKYEKKTKIHMRGHEGLSFYKAIPLVQELKDFGVLNQEEMEDILIIISMHGTLFDSIDSEGNMKNENKVFDKFEKSQKGMQLFENFVKQVRNDSLGRFYVSKDGRKSFAYNLGTKIFTSGDFGIYCMDRGYPNLPQKEDKLKLTVLIGAPGCGKSTWIKKNVTNEVVISRDAIVEQFAIDNNLENEDGTKMNYSQTWKYLTDVNSQPEIDRILELEFQEALKARKSIVIDMTNVSNKAQRKWKNKVTKDYFAEAIIFATGYDEVYRRLDKRERETGKIIPPFAVGNMMRGFMVPNYSTFDNLKWVF